MSTQNIVRGVMITFDLFSKKDIEKVNAKVKDTFEVEPTIQKSAIIGDSLETKNVVWKIESLRKLFATLKGICDEKGWTCNFDLMAKYVESFQVWGYDSPNLPFYILMAKITMNKETLNSCENLRDDLSEFGLAIRLFIESLQGFRKTMTTFSPSSPAITQLWIKVDKKEFSEMRKIELTLINKKEELSFDQKKTLSRKLRRLEPVDLSTPVGDIHSHIFFAMNLTYILGHITQLGLGGMMTPYILYVSYDEKLLQQDLTGMPLGPAEILIGGGIVQSEFAHLIGLISLLIYLSHLAFEREKIDREVSKLRDSITQKNFELTLDQELSKLNNFGTQISSLQQTIGRFSRYWERSLRQISEGKDRLTIEVPLEITETYGLFNITHKGYLGTLADQILVTLKNDKEFLEKQGLEIASLRTHISDIVNLRISKSNENLQKSMKRLAEISAAVAIISLIISVVNWFVFVLL